MLTLMMLTACGTDAGFTPLVELLDSFAFVDAGAVAPNQRQSFAVPLFSAGEAPLEIYAIEVNDLTTGAPSDAFATQPWVEEDCLEEVEGNDCVLLEPYDDESDDDTLLVEMFFQPPAEGFFEATMKIWSTDNQRSAEQEQPLPSSPEGNTYAVWNVQLRGLSREPCAELVPEFIDFGDHSTQVGGNYTAAFEIRNCGVVKVEVAAAAFGESDSARGSVNLNTLLPIYVLPRDAEPVEISWIVGSSAPISGDLGFTTNGDPGALYNKPLRVIGSKCDESADRSFDGDGDGWFSCGRDCDDTDGTVNPSVAERPDNLVDDDCDGEIDEESGSASTDDDGDGCAETGTGCISGYDCDDNDPLVGPGNVEIENNIDDNCDGRIDEGTGRFDDDNDGWDEREGDCNDADGLVNPDAVEDVNGLDDDCDGTVDESGPDIDDDEDLMTDTAGDCDDGDPWTYDGAREYCDDIDNDCDGTVDEGEDGSIDGACPLAADGQTTTTAPQRGGCTTGSGPWWLGLLAAPMLRRRRA